MRFYRRRRGGGGGQGDAVDEDVLVGCTPAFGRDDGGVVCLCDFVDDADEGRVRGGRVEGLDVCDAGLEVGYSGEVEDELERGDCDDGGGEGFDAAAAFEGCGAEVGAVGEVEDVGPGGDGGGGGGLGDEEGGGVEGAEAGYGAGDIAHGAAAEDGGGRAGRHCGRRRAGGRAGAQLSGGCLAQWLLGGPGGGLSAAAKRGGGF